MAKASSAIQKVGRPWGGRGTGKLLPDVSLSGAGAHPFDICQDVSNDD